MRVDAGFEGMHAFTSSGVAVREQEEGTHAARAIQTPSPPNHLLGALEPEWERVRQSLRLVDLPWGRVLCEEGRALKTLIFPTTAIVSISCRTADGNGAEVAVVGNEGVVGPGVPDVPDPNPFHVAVQAAGAAFVMDTATQIDRMPGGDRLSRQVVRFSRSLLAQIAQVALCMRFHSIEQQLCRRLLMGLDRSPRGALSMTHQSAALLMGVRREGVTNAANRLRRAGAIQYRRGHIDVIDRARLEARACACYDHAKRAYERTRLPSSLT